MGVTDFFANDASNYAVEIKNTGSGGKALRLLYSTTNTLLEAEDDGAKFYAKPGGGTKGAVVAQAGTSGSPVDLSSLIGSKRYAPVTGIMYSALGTSPAANNEAFGVVGYNVGRSGDGGYAIGVYGRGEFPSGGVSLTRENSATGVLGEGLVNVNNGIAKGANFRAESLAGTGTTAVGVEINVRADQGANGLEDRIGLMVTAVGQAGESGTGDGTGSDNDAAIWTARKLPASGFKYGLYFARPSFNTGASEGVGFGVQDGGSLIAANADNEGTGADANIARGIDFANIVFSEAAFLSNNFKVAGDGNVSLMSSNRYVTFAAQASSDSGGIRFTESGGSLRPSFYMDSSNILRLGNANNEMKVDAGEVGFFGVSPVPRQSVGGSASGAAAVEVLANNLRSALIALGLCQT